jgi:hypothetical protein
VLEYTKPFWHDDGMASPDRKRLGNYVTNRRVALGYKDRRKFAAATGLTDRTIAKIEVGTQVSMASLVALEPALGWEPGSMQAILDGGEPIMPGQERPARPAPKPPVYADPYYQRAWDALDGLGFSDEVKSAMIRLARGAALEEEERRRTG